MHGLWIEDDNRLTLRPDRAGATLSSSTPSPTSSGIIVALAAASPHTALAGRGHARAHDAIDQAKDRGLKELTPVDELRVGPVGRHRVLDEVVRPDRGRSRPTRQGVGHHAAEGTSIITPISTLRSGRGLRRRRRS
jgi:hypothetical protein